MSLEKIIKTALAEDKAYNDITSNLTILKNNSINFEIKAREDIVFCGSEIISKTFKILKNYKKFEKSTIFLDFIAKNGDFIKKNQIIAKGKGDAKLIFAGERVVLNLIQHLSGISTLTNQFVKKLNNSKIKILDTRKTLPNLRDLQKQAVICGGGKNHRFNLSDMILIKDNHIAAAGGIEKALKLAKKSNKKVEIECDNFNQVLEAIKLSPDVIMLDNMEAKKIEKCSKSIRENSKKTKIEISGGINLKNIENFSKLDIDFISIGAITHSVRAVDIGLDIK